MPAVSNVSSFRKVTPGILASQRLAMSNDIPDIGKSEVAIALKRAAQPIGLTSTAYHVLDILLGLSKPDFERLFLPEGDAGDTCVPASGNVERHS